MSSSFTVVLLTNPEDLYKFIYNPLLMLLPTLVNYSQYSTCCTLEYKYLLLVASQHLESHSLYFKQVLDCWHILGFTFPYLWGYLTHQVGKLVSIHCLFFLAKQALCLSVAQGKLPFTVMLPCQELLNKHKTTNSQSIYYNCFLFLQSRVIYWEAALQAANQ